MGTPIILLAILAMVVASDENLPDSDFKEWKAKFGVVYDIEDGARIENFRLERFKMNKVIIEAHNARARRGELSFFLGQNRFADMYENEIQSTRGGFSEFEFLRGSPYSLFEFTIPSGSVIPESIDWREMGAVSRVKDQGECHSSWAFAATGALESHNFIKTGQQMSLSEQNLIDCTRRYGNNGCRGGTITKSFEYVKENQGIDSEESYRYAGRDFSFDICRFRRGSAGAANIGFTDIDKGNDDMLLAAVALKGPVSVAIDASSDLLALYSNGIFTSDFCTPGLLTHAVLLVGYGSENGHDYWILKNSWGPTWGENGYMRLSRKTKNSCGISTAAAFPVF